MECSTKIIKDNNLSGCNDMHKAIHPHPLKTVTYFAEINSWYSLYKTTVRGRGWKKRGNDHNSFTSTPLTAFCFLQTISDKPNKGKPKKRSHLYK